jgi:hypothetical protein
VWIFFIFILVRFASAQLRRLLLSPPRCHLSSGRCRHTTALCHASFPLSHDKFAASASSFGNTLSHRLSFRAETEALNPHHRCRLSSSDCPTPILQCYKKIISTLATLPTTEPRLHLASSLARAPRHQCSTHHHHSLSPQSHAHRPSAQ